MNAKMLTTVVLVAVVVALAVVALTPALQAQSKAPAAAGRYTVAGGDKTFVLCDTLTGKTWYFEAKLLGKEYAWVPILTRLDSEEDAKKWRDGKFHRHGGDD